MKNNYVIIPAGGVGRRFGGSTKKQFLKLGGKTLLQWTVSAFVEAGIFKKIIVCLPVDELKQARLLFPSPNISCIEGGASRALSVFEGFKYLQADANDIVLIHDAVRPLVSLALIKNVVKQASAKGAAIPVIPVSDTIKEIQKEIVVRTVDRRHLYAVQTPQGFSYEILSKAYQKGRLGDRDWTDEAMLVEGADNPIYIVEGEPENIKVTTKVDLKMAELLLEKS